MTMMMMKNSVLMAAHTAGQIWERYGVCYLFLCLQINASIGLMVSSSALLLGMLMTPLKENIYVYFGGGGVFPALRTEGGKGLISPRMQRLSSCGGLSPIFVSLFACLCLSPLYSALNFFNFESFEFVTVGW